MLEQLLIPVVIIGGLGIIFGLGLAYTSKKFAVEVDERIEKVRALLPGANCGACGQTGCDGFAEAVVSGKCSVNGCPVGGADLAKSIGEILGVEAEISEKKVARVLCGGNNETCKVKLDYSGIKTCAAAAALHGGPSACSYGCVGMGDCAKECPFGAIVVENGLARIITSKCTGCTKCVASCPKGIIEMIPESRQYTVKCSSLDKGANVRKNCSVGCIGCGKCTKACAYNAIKLNGTLAKIDTELCTNCGECAKVCPTGAICTYNSCVGKCQVV